MSGRHKFSELVAKLPPERQVRVAQMADAMICAQLRGNASQLSQAALGDMLPVEQPAYVAKVEKCASCL